MLSITTSPESVTMLSALQSKIRTTVEQLWTITIARFGWALGKVYGPDNTLCDACTYGPIGEVDLVITHTDRSCGIPGFFTCYPATNTKGNVKRFMLALNGTWETKGGVRCRVTKINGQDKAEWGHSISELPRIATQKDVAQWRHMTKLMPNIQKRLFELGAQPEVNSSFDQRRLATVEQRRTDDGFLSELDETSTPCQDDEELMGRFYAPENWTREDTFTVEHGVSNKYVSLNFYQKVGRSQWNKLGYVQIDSKVGYKTTVKRNGVTHVVDTDPAYLTGDDHTYLIDQLKRYCADGEFGSVRLIETPLSKQVGKDGMPLLKCPGCHNERQHVATRTHISCQDCSWNRDRFWVEACWAAEDVSVNNKTLPQELYSKLRGPGKLMVSIMIMGKRAQEIIHAREWLKPEEKKAVLAPKTKIVAAVTF